MGTGSAERGGQLASNFSKVFMCSPSLLDSCSAEELWLAGECVRWEAIGKGMVVDDYLQVVQMVPMWSAGFSSVLGCNLGR